MGNKLRRQHRIKQGREWKVGGLPRTVAALVNRDARLFRCYPSFVIATIVTQHYQGTERHFDCPEQEDYADGNLELRRAARK